MKKNEDGTWSVYTDEERNNLSKSMNPRRYRCTPATDYGRMYYYLKTEVCDDDKSTQ